MQVIWTVAAEADLDAAWAYIAADNFRAAESVCDRILDAVNRLSIHPRLGRPGRLIGTRELAVSDTAYVVVYEVHAAEVAILRVLHDAMKWPRPT